MMAKDAFVRFWEWADKTAESSITVPAYLHEAVMQLQPERRFDRTAVNVRIRVPSDDRKRFEAEILENEIITPIFPRARLSF
jgi:hypothetical protein